MRRFFMLLLVGITLSPGCLHLAQVTWSIEAPATMKAAILQYVPPGTPAREAKQFMEQEGFACTLQKNGTFFERVAWYDSGPKHEGIDFLDCQRTQTESFMMSRNWRVALVLQNDLVTDILVGHWVDGP
jgi:hypothetical protein